MPNKWSSRSWGKFLPTSYLAYFSTLKMEAINYSETLVNVTLCFILFTEQLWTKFTFVLQYKSPWARDMDFVHVLLPLELTQSVETLIECTAMRDITEDPTSDDSITNFSCVNIELACIVTFPAARGSYSPRNIRWGGRDLLYASVQETATKNMCIQAQSVSLLRKLWAPELQLPEWQDGTGRVGILHCVVSINNRGGQTADCGLDKNRGAVVKMSM
jgi:hypothetical protein